MSLSSALKTSHGTYTMTILVFEDKLGITTGYEGHWSAMLHRVGIVERSVQRYNLWKSPLARTNQLIIKKGNRLSPGFNPDPIVQKRIKLWIDTLIQKTKPEVIVCMDLALLGQVEPMWDVATIDNMRGGLYNYHTYPWYVMTPISAINRKKSTKDIALMNKGATSKSEFDMRVVNITEDADSSDTDDDDGEPEEIYFEPYFVPLGKWVFGADMNKLAKIIEEQRGG